MNFISNYQLHKIKNLKGQNDLEVIKNIVHYLKQAKNKNKLQHNSKNAGFIFFSIFLKEQPCDRQSADKLIF